MKKLIIYGAFSAFMMAPLMAASEDTSERAKKALGAFFENKEDKKDEKKPEIKKDQKDMKKKLEGMSKDLKKMQEKINKMIKGM